MTPSADDVARRHAERARRAEGPVHVTYRGLRDELGLGRWTDAARTELEAALGRAGLACEPPLAHARRLDQTIELRRVRWRRTRAAGRRVVAVLGPVELAISLVVGVVAVVGFALLLWPDKPRAMSGDVNILVVPFAVEDGGDARVGEKLAETSREMLDEGEQVARQRHDLDVELRGPEGLDPVTGTPAEQQAAAERLAREHDADLVLLGVVSHTAREDRVTPAIYVSAEKLPDAAELERLHELRAVVQRGGAFDDALLPRKRLRAGLQRSVDGMLAFALGLAHFRERDWRAAAARFAEAADSRSAVGVGAFVHLFEGNVAGKLGDLDAAQRAYAKARGDEQAELRARLGRAEILHQRAQHGCRRATADVPGLHEALAAFRAGLRDAERLQSTAGRVRAHLGSGRTLVCLSQAEAVAGWEEARSHLRDTLAAIEAAPDPDRFADERAEAHANLGFALLPPPDRRDDLAAYRLAGEQYRAAARATSDPRRRAGFQLMLEFIHRRLGEPELADRAAGRMRRLDRRADRRERTATSTGESP